MRSPKIFAAVLPLLLLTAGGVQAGVIVTQGFEEPEDLGNKQTRFYREITTPESISLVTEPVRSGKQAMKFHFVATDWKKSEPKRVEIFNAGAWGPDGMTLRKDWWLGVSEFFPTDWQEDHPNNAEIVWQFHGYEGGPASNNPPLAAMISGDKLVIRLAQGTVPAASATSYLDLATLPIPKGRWTDFVMNVNWDYKAGHVKLWLNGKQIVDYHGPTLYPMIGQVNEKGPMPKFGVYKWDWGNVPTLAKERTLYVDEIRFGDSNSSFEEVSPR